MPLPVLPEGIKMIDTHCHLDMLEAEMDTARVIQRAAENAIASIITIGIDVESTKKAIAIAQKHDGVYATVGIHPHNVQELSADSYDELENLCRSEKVVAYGEIGLDFVKQYAPQRMQLDHFARQVELAQKTGLPLVIHDREAHPEIMKILRNAAPFEASGVMHCFSGDWRLASRVLDLGFLISIPGVVTFNKADILQDVVRRIPLDRLVLETDAPFLAPDPYRGRTNFPEYILYTAKKVADLRGISIAEVARSTTDNARKLFHLPAH